MNEAVTLHNVGQSIGRPLLSIQQGLFAKEDGSPTYKQVLLANWNLAQGGLAGELSVTAYLFAHEYNGTDMWLAELVFMDSKTGRWSPWRTYRIDVPAGTYLDDRLDEVKALLKVELSSTP